MKTVLHLTVWPSLFICEYIFALNTPWDVFTKNDNPPYTHNLDYLAIQSGIYETMTEDQKDTMDIIEPLNIEARYPTHKEKLIQTFNYERCKDIIQKTEVLYQWIKKFSSVVKWRPDKSSPTYSYHTSKPL